METISYPEWHGIMKEHRDIKCIEQNQDMPIVFTGDEGSGKSTLSLALGGIDPDFFKHYKNRQEQVYFLWDKFLEANQLCTVNSCLKALNNIQEEKRDQIKSTLLKKYGISEKKLEVPEERLILEEGSYLQYDEAGTQMFSRDHQTKAVKDQVKLFISNRSNRMVYALNIPKIKYLDKYVREERIKYFVFIKVSFPNDDLRNPLRVAYIWGRDRYLRMINHPYWWQLFHTNMGKLFKISDPNFRIELPRLVGANKPIPQDIYDIYMAEKTMFQLKQSIEMRGEAQEGGTGPKKNNTPGPGPLDLDERKPRPGESRLEYCERRRCSPSTADKYFRIYSSPEPG